MLKPVIFNPNFLKEVFKETESRDKFKEFFENEILPYQNQILFLLDDKKNRIRNEYLKICNDAQDGSLIQMFIKDYLLQIKHENFPEDFEINRLNEHIEKLKFKPLLFNKKEDIKKKLHLKRLNETQIFPLSKEKFESIISDFTRFSNKITIIDPYIAPHLTNLDSGHKNKSYYSKYKIFTIADMIENIDRDKNYIPDFSIKLKKNTDYRITLKELLNIIINNNVSQKTLDIEIITAIKIKDIEAIWRCMDILKKKISNEDDKKKKEKFEMLYNQINNQIYETSISTNIVNRIKFLLSTKKDVNINFKIKESKIKESKKKNEDVYSEIYHRSILMRGNVVGALEVKPGVSFFSFSTGKLHTSDKYYLKLIFDDPKLKNLLEKPKHFPDFDIKEKKLN